MNTYVIRIQCLNTRTLEWTQALAVRVRPSDQQELDRISDEILNEWIRQNPNRPATYAQSVWRASYKA